MKKNQLGFGHLALLLVVIIISLIVAVGWLVYDRQKKTKNQEPSNATIQKQETSKEEPKPVDPYENWQTTNFELIEGSFKHPKYFKMTHESNPDAGPNAGLETYSLTAEDNSMIVLTAYHFMGGFTGDEPKYLIDDVVTATTTSSGREFSSIIYKNDDGVYDGAHVMETTVTKYKVGERSQIFLTAFGAKPKNANKETTRLSITFYGPEKRTYKALADVKSIVVYKDIQKFLNALNIPVN